MSGEQFFTPPHDAGLIIASDRLVGSFQIVHDSGAPIVTIYLDGRVEVNPAFSVDEAARAFWDAVIQLSPGGKASGSA